MGKGAGRALSRLGGPVMGALQLAPVLMDEQASTMKKQAQLAVQPVHGSAVPLAALPDRWVRLPVPRWAVSPGSIWAVL
ncbi:phage tape measure protein [Escherichia coli]|nr:phage tape measure protein [Escherichia coli]